MLNLVFLLSNHLKCFLLLARSSFGQVHQWLFGLLISSDCFCLVYAVLPGSLDEIEKSRTDSFRNINICGKQQDIAVLQPKHSCSTQLHLLVKLLWHKTSSSAFSVAENQHELLTPPFQLVTKFAIFLSSQHHIIAMNTNKIPTIQLVFPLTAECT